MSHFIWCFCRGLRALLPPSSCTSGLSPAQSRAVCFESAKEPSTPPPNGQNRVQVRLVVKYSRCLQHSSVSLCVLIMKKFFQPHGLKQSSEVTFNINSYSANSKLRKFNCKPTQAVSPVGEKPSLAQLHQSIL